VSGGTHRHGRADPSRVEPLDRPLDLTGAEAQLARDRVRHGIAFTRNLLDHQRLFVGVSTGAITRVAVRIATETDEGNVVFIVADDGWRYLSSGIYTRPLAELDNPDATVWW